ncbi:MAG: DUF1844 domain-containing protein [Verrucomicrobia bacterium]|nr:DUF1844 domain-containing protein [Verrucomicrobiota bacterium]
MSEASTESNIRPAAPADLSREEMQSAIFAQMILQQSNLAMMLMGKVPNPQTGQTESDLEAARFFIDQLEVIEAKTKGNLTRHEEALLKQTLMTVRLAFVEAVPTTQPPAQAVAAESSTPTTQATPSSETKTAPAESAGAVQEEESRKRYSKKFSL